MNTKYLKEFLILAETKNYWEASERLFMNQSTLSKHIRALETELDVPLFTRTTRRVELTSYGKTLYPYAKNIAKLEFEYQSLFMQMKNAEKGIMTLGTIPTMAQYNITKLLLNFNKQYPSSNIRILEADPHQLENALYDGSCELIIQRETKMNFEQNFLKNENVMRIPYVQDHMVAILPIGHRLASKDNLHLQELKNENFCLIKEGSLMYELCTSACQTAGFIPQIVLSTHRINNILNMVVNDGCVALLMNHHVALTELLSGSRQPFIVLDIVPKIHSQISLCYLKNINLSPTAKNFIEFFKNICPYKKSD